MTTQPSRRVGHPPATLDGRTVPERPVEVALRLFAEKGFESTSMQDVVSAAGVTKGAMYHYFGSKDDLPVKNLSIVGLHGSLYNRHDPPAVQECHRALTELADQGGIAPPGDAGVA